MIDYFAIIIIGGMGSLLGSVLGAIVWKLLPQVLQTLAQSVDPDTPVIGDLLDNYQGQTVAMILGLLIILIMIFKPAGLNGIWLDAKTGCRKWPYTLTPRARRDGGRRVLEVRGLEVAYGASAPALRGVTLEVREGTAVALLGANGAGKTTTIRAISRPAALHRAHPRGHGAARRQPCQRRAREQDRRARRRPGARGPHGLRRADGRGESAHRRHRPARAVSLEDTRRRSSLFPQLRTAATTRRAGCRAASSRWSRSAAG